jgi:hypothetical protein
MQNQNLAETWRGSRRLNNLRGTGPRHWKFQFNRGTDPMIGAQKTGREEHRKMAQGTEISKNDLKASPSAQDPESIARVMNKQRGVGEAGRTTETTRHVERMRTHIAASASLALATSLPAVPGLGSFE